MAKLVRVHTQLDVFARSFSASMDLFRISRAFPKEEKYSLTDQIRRSSRSVSANIAEGWRKRRYPAAFASKLNDAEAEAAETQVWIQYAVECEYIPADEGRRIYAIYDTILQTLVGMINHKGDWALKGV